MTAPLDFDGIEAKVQIDSPKIGDLFKFAGADLEWDASLYLAASFGKEGVDWNLIDSDGAISKNRFGARCV